jgi:hypothetical protein
MKTSHTQNHIAAALGYALALTATTLVAQDVAAEDEKAKAAELAMNSRTASPASSACRFRTIETSASAQRTPCVIPPTYSP